jgi:SAM-dependent methyltransferase
MTHDACYTDRLIREQTIWWKRLLDVQAPYRWNLRRLQPGFTLDVGCGIGRNLGHLRGQGIGVDHNPLSVNKARERGFSAFTPEEFRDSPYCSAQHFDSLLLAHVAEHMRRDEVIEVLKMYLGLLKPTAQLIMITPQEAGYRSDETHVEFMDFAKLRGIASELGFTVLKEFSFPFPRFAGHVFRYNEFVSVSCKLQGLAQQSWGERND